MLIEEAKWLGRQIVEHNADSVFPLLNLGSSTEEFRKKGQPWIDKYLFSPLQRAGCQVIHSDIRTAPGVDLVGDITSQKFADEIDSLGVMGVLCSNMLEHVPDPKRIAQSIVRIVPPGGLIFVTCPYKYPYHADPIDNGLRPTIEELSKLFPGTKLMHGEIIECGSYGAYLWRDKQHAVRMLIRLFFPFYRPRAWLTLVNHWLWFFRRFSASCVILCKMP